MTTLATPSESCTCGHKKSFHAWINKQTATVSFASCGSDKCSCQSYKEGKPHGKFQQFLCRIGWHQWVFIGPDPLCMSAAERCDCGRVRITSFV